MEKFSDLGTGYWITPSGELIQCGDFHENAALQQLFDLNAFVSAIDGLRGQPEFEPDSQWLLKFAIISPNTANILRKTAQEFFASEASDTTKQAVRQVMVDASSEEVTNALLDPNPAPAMLRLFLEQGAIRLRVRGNDVFVEFRGSPSANAVIKFLTKHGMKDATVMLDNGSKNIKISMNRLFKLRTLDEDFPKPQGSMMARLRSMYAAKIEKLVKFANSYEMLVKEAGKYDHIDFKPPQSVANAAKRGLELRKKNKGKGGLSSGEAGKQGIGSGVQRASDLSHRENLSPGTVRRMKAFFDRHQKNKSASGGKSKEQDKGYISWLLWGGDPGYAWAKKVVKQMEAADKKKS